MDEDSILMLKFKEGDVSAFETLMRKYKKQVLNVVYRYLGNSNEAEDIAQEVFIKVYQGGSNYKPTAKFFTWLYRITANLCTDYRRKKKPVFVQMDDKELAAKERADGRVEEKRIEEIVRNALDKLPAQQRIAVVLNRYDELTMEEIADVLKMPVNTVKSLIHRAKISLKNYIEPYLEN